MTRRRWVYLGLAVLLALGLAVRFFWPSPFPVRAYERLRLGMTKSEVEAIIGEPPTRCNFFRYSVPIGSISPPDLPVIGSRLRETGIRCADVREGQPLDGWEWEDGGLWVTYDRDGQAVGYYLVGPMFPPPTFLDRVRAWLDI